MRLLFIGEHPHEIKFLYHEGTEKACALRAVGKASSVGMDLLMSLLGFSQSFMVVLGLNFHRKPEVSTRIGTALKLCNK